MLKKQAFLIIALLFLVLFLSPARLIMSELFLGQVDKFIYENFNDNKLFEKPADNFDDCEKDGGKWEKIGLRQSEICETYSNDGDKICFSGFQCQLGNCESTSKFPITAGKCQRVLHRRGCFADIHFWVKNLNICID